MSVKKTFLKSMVISGIFLLSNPVNAQEIDHSKMDHSKMMHQPEKVPAVEPASEVVDHSKMDHSTMNHAKAVEPSEPNTPLRVLTDADRLAAFPKLDAHTMHGESTWQSMLLIDQLEVWDASPGAGMAWDAVAWWGSDTSRVWLRTEGERVDSHLESAVLEVFVGRSIAPWWDFLVGVRHDFKPGQSQDFLAIGVMGLSPYKFETDMTLYIGESGQVAARLQFEYETLLTNRLILQPKVEMNVYGNDDPARAIGSGLSNIELGLRLRYEINRQFAPYVGVSWDKRFGQTADYLSIEGQSTTEFTVLAGVRVWF